MSEPLLHTKLFVPPLRPYLVHRPHLIDRLDRALQLGQRLTLLSAPAGFGKTTMVSQWVDKIALDSDKESPSVIKIAWISLDEGDNDLTRFLTYIVAALSQVEGVEADFGKGAQGMLQSPQPPPSEPFLTSLINEIAAIPFKIILVFDDYHLIDSLSIDSALTFLLEHLPPQLHLVIATRDDPNLPAARLRARGQLTELRAADLRFTSSEAAEFLNQVMGLDLAAADISALETRTEGWIAGLQLAALSMQGREDASDLVKSFTGSHRFVLDYLMEEVLEQQSDSIKSFLMQTAILERLTGSLCDALTGQDNGQVTLESLERANLFVVTLDEERLWYRYHHLFADLLRQRLHQTRPGKAAMLHIKAAEWFNQQGLNREAIRHLLAAKEYKGAAELIDVTALDIMQQGEHTAVMRWINALPDELVAEQPHLCVLHAWALQLAGQLEEAEARLLDAENSLSRPEYEDDGNSKTILGLIHSHRAYLAFMTGEHEQTIYYARQALIQLPDSAALIRAQTSLYLGVAYRYQGQLLAALDIYRDTLPITQGMGGKAIAVLCFLHLADLHWQLAQLHRAKAYCEQALDTTEKHTGRPDRPFTGFAYVRIGRILRQWNQLQDAHRITLKGLALCRAWNVADILALSYIELAHICQALGEEEQARTAINEAMKIYDDFSPWGSQYGAAHRAQIDLQRGDIDAAASWAEAVDLVIDSDFEFHRENEYLALAHVLLAQKRYEEAQALVERITRIAEEIGNRQTEIEGHILLALLFSEQGDGDQALIHLEKALIMGEPEGFIRIFVDQGRPMARLLYAASSRRISADYVGRLLAAFPSVKAESTVKAKAPLLQDELVESLSARELEVLQLIADGLSNADIASRLYLSLNTVKVHSRNIYGKLGVHNRMQAVVTAQNLGILPES